LLVCGDELHGDEAFVCCPEDILLGEGEVLHRVTENVVGHEVDTAFVVFPDDGGRLREAKFLKKIPVQYDVTSRLACCASFSIGGRESGARKGGAAPRKEAIAAVESVPKTGIARAPLGRGW
jgi:hypothetical protein